MAKLNFRSVLLTGLFFSLSFIPILAQEQGPVEEPAKIYVPYEELHEVLSSKEQGVFLPYREFQQLWQAAQHKPVDISQLPFDYLISTARFTGNVDDKVAKMKLALTVDILSGDWVDIPIGLDEVAVSGVSLSKTEKESQKPLLRIVKGQYVITTKGKGRITLIVDFVRQLQSQPGLNILNYRIPSAAITTLELLIPEENMNVEVKPMLAATTSQVDIAEQKGTKLQAFLGSAKNVHLSWKPKSESAADLEPVVISEQFQEVHIGEALIKYSVRFDYTLHRGGVDSFEISTPKDFRITDVIGANIAKWDIQESEKTPKLQVKLFSPAKEKYSVTVKMERFLQEESVEVPLKQVSTKQTFRSSGLIAVTYSPRRTVHLKDISNLARVDTGRLPENLQKQRGVTAYRFITSDYSAVLDIKTAAPRIEARQYWIMDVGERSIRYSGDLKYTIKNTGIFELSLLVPNDWDVTSVGPSSIVDDFQIQQSGKNKNVNILLKKEVTGSLDLQLYARTGSSNWQQPVFPLPLPEMKNLKWFSAQLMLVLPEQLRAEVTETRQALPLSLKDARKWKTISGKRPAIAFNFQSVDRDKPADVLFKIETKATQISATAHRLVNIQPGFVEQQTVIQYDIRYSPVNTFYIKVPKDMANAELKISGNNIKEKPRIDELPQAQQTEAQEPASGDWAYYKIVLQSKIKGRYDLYVNSRKSFQAGQSDKPVMVDVKPILAAGILSSQKGFIAVQKADTLAIGIPEMDNLTPADPGSETDLPYQPHRTNASLAFKYFRPPFELSMPVIAQKEAKVFTTIVNGAVVEQILARDGMLNTRALFLLATSQGDRLPITLPKGAELTAVLINGNEAPVEMGTNKDERIVRLPPSAGQVVHFQLEVAYGVKDVGAFSLTTPSLPADIPVQQTLWRLWVPRDDYVLGHNRVFSEISEWQAQNILNTLAPNQSGQIAFKLTGQGKVVNFLRQGAGGKLSLLTMRKELFNIVVWFLVIAVGVLMLKLSEFKRLQVILGIILAGAVLNLFAPLLAEQIFASSFLAVFLVVLLWIGHWLLYRWPKIRQSRNQRKKAKQSELTQAVAEAITETSSTDNKE